MLKQFWKTSALASAAALLALGGCGGNKNNDANSANTAGATSEAPVKSLTIGYNATIVQPQPLIGLESEYSRQLPQTTFGGKQFKAGPDVVDALRSGSIDIGCSGAWPAMKAFAKDGDLILLCGAATGGTQLMVAGKSPIKTVKDLRGKTIGVNQLGSTVETMVRAQLVEAGLNPERDVKLIQLEPAEQAEALKSGDADAIAAPAPWPSVAQVTAQARPLLNSKQIFNNGNYLAGSVYTTKKFAAEHPQFLAKFIAANDKITQDLNADRAQGDARVLAAWSKVSKKTLKPDVARAAFKTITFTNEVNPKGLQDFADLAFKVGLLKKKADLNGFVFKKP